MEKILEGLVYPVVTGVIVAFVLWILKTPKTVNELRLDAVRQEASEARAKIDAHIELCEEVPNIWVKAKLEELCEKQDEQHEEVKGRLDKVDLNLDRTRDRLEQHALAILKLETKRSRI